MEVLPTCRMARMGIPVRMVSRELRMEEKVVIQAGSYSWIVICSIARR